MKLHQFFPVLFYLILLIFSLCVCLPLAAWLQGWIAIRFGLTGEASGWMEAETFKSYALWLGFGLSLLPPILVGMLRFRGHRWLKIPNKEYWAQPENWRKACNQLFLSSFWPAGQIVACFIGFFSLIVFANRQTPPELSGTVWLFIAFSLFALMDWIKDIFRFFNKRPDDS